MMFTTQQLQTIEKLASAYFKISEIALMIDVDELLLRDQIADRNSEAYKAYTRGKLSFKLQIRAQMAKLAKVGSPSAIDMAERALLDMEDDE